jgi:oxygen-dependent protoporphyrinogen oxidase
MTETRRERIAIIGGGITGLACAHRVFELTKHLPNPPEIILFEAASVAGGVISSLNLNNAIMELGPDSFITEKPWALDLCQRLGLTNQIIPTQEAKRRTFIASGNKLHPLPDGFVMLAPTKLLPFATSPIISLRGKLRMALDILIPKRKIAEGQNADESLADFVTRRLGKEALDRIAQPMISGIYTADPTKLSVTAAMPRLPKMEEEHGSIIKALLKRNQNSSGTAGARYSLFVSLDQGLSLLIKTIIKNLPEGFLRLNTKVAEIVRTPCKTIEGQNPKKSVWQIKLQDGSTCDATALIVSTPAHQSAKLLESVDPNLSTKLNAIPYASSAVVNLLYEKKATAGIIDGFGFVVPACEKRAILACTISSNKFANRAPEGYVALRIFLGGAMQPESYALSDDQMLKAVKTDLRDLLGITAEPVSHKISRYPLSMPQYHLGHLALVKEIGEASKDLPNFALAGNAFHGVGIPDCIHSGEIAAEQILSQLNIDPKS